VSVSFGEPSGLSPMIYHTDQIAVHLGVSGWCREEINEFEVLCQTMFQERLTYFKGEKCPKFSSPPNSYPVLGT
jgi:hypothetical protein